MSPHRAPRPPPACAHTPDARTAERRNGGTSLRRSRSLLPALLVFSVCALGGPPPVHAPQHEIQAQARFQILASGLHDPTGLARDPQTGDLFVAEAGTGVLARITPAGAVTTLVTGFRRPRGLAWVAGGTAERGNGGTLLA